MWNNLSAPVYPTGIGVKLDIGTIDGDLITLRSEDLKWKVFTATFDDSVLSEEKEISYNLLNKDNLLIEKHFIAPGHASESLQTMDYLFIEPILEDSRFAYSHIEFWILIFFASLGLLYLLVCYRKKNICLDSP